MIQPTATSKYDSTAFGIDKYQCNTTNHKKRATFIFMITLAKIDRF